MHAPPPPGSTADLEQQGELQHAIPIPVHALFM